MINELQIPCCSPGANVQRSIWNLEALLGGWQEPPHTDSNQIVLAPTRYDDHDNRTFTYHLSALLPYYLNLNTYRLPTYLPTLLQSIFRGPGPQGMAVNTADQSTDGLRFNVGSPVLFLVSRHKFMDTARPCKPKYPFLAIIDDKIIISSDDSLTAYAAFVRKQGA